MGKLDETWDWNRPSGQHRPVPERRSRHREPEQSSEPEPEPEPGPPAAPRPEQPTTPPAAEPAASVDRPWPTVDTPRSAPPRVPVPRPESLLSGEARPDPDARPAPKPATAPAPAPRFTVEPPKTPVTPPTATVEAPPATVAPPPATVETPRVETPTIQPPKVPPPKATVAPPKATVAPQTAVVAPLKATVAPHPAVVAPPRATVASPAAHRTTDPVPAPPVRPLPRGGTGELLAVTAPGADLPPPLTAPPVRSTSARAGRGRTRWSPRLIFVLVLVGLIGLVVALVANTGTPDRPGGTALDGAGPTLTDEPTPTMTVDPTGTPTAGPSVTASAVPAPTTTGSVAKPSTSTTRPRATTRAATPTKPPVVFRTQSIQAEAPGNTLLGGAAAWPCTPCDGGQRVAYIGGAAQVIVRTTVAVTGTRRFTLTYEVDGPRLLKVSANGVLIAQQWLTGTGWEVPRTLVFTAKVTAGPLQLTFYNDEGPAPDLDKIVIT